MDDNNVTYLTKDGLQKLESELEHLRTVRRSEVASRLHQAIEDGELIENAEYEAAKNEQAFVEGRILSLRNMLSKVEVIEEKDEGPPETVHIGSEVIIQENGSKRERYVIVGAAEASPVEGRISNESPLGRALLGCRVGEEVNVTAPAGELSFRVVKIC